MSEPTDTGAAGAGPAPKGSTPPPFSGTSESSTPDAPTRDVPATDSPADSGEARTTRFPAAQQHRAEGGSGGVARAHSGGAAGQAAPMVSPAERRGPMESVLVLRRIDPWSAFTTVLGLMFALYLVWMVAVGVVYLLMSGMGVWDRLGGLLSGVAGDASATVIGPSTIFLYAGGVGLLNVLLLSILATLAVFIYNLVAGLTGGGVQLTLGDRRR
ncbi:DUF3566 domain-containing protein [Dietzia sp. 179-F 9C3 NHS]|uniref:DUF3566 domain-containing protein n=1 Tax=Dietzia sp. 179-F 9C3 NHS TaxID=3374295 RepID=UPI0038792C09